MSALTTLERGSTMRARQRNIIKVQLQPGQILEKVPGGYIIAAGRNATGEFTLELQPGECLHRIVGGYIVQPCGAPTLNAKGVQKRIKRSINWIHILTRRGPLHELGGLQGYVVGENGDCWVPKIGTGKNGSEVMYYLSDVAAWELEFAPPSEDEEEDLTRFLNREVPAPIYELFKRLGSWEQLERGYVTRTRIMGEAKLLTRYKQYQAYLKLAELAEKPVKLDELAKTLKGTPEYDPIELMETFGISKPISDRYYEDLMAVAIQEGWADNPKRKANTSTYRRKPRALLIKS